MNLPLGFALYFDPRDWSVAFKLRVCWWPGWNPRKEVDAARISSTTLYQIGAEIALGPLRVTWLVEREL